MAMRKSALAALGLFLFLAICSPVLAQNLPPPPGFGQPAPLPPPNGHGHVTFNHGGTTMTLPLNKIEIETSTPDMFMVSLTYVDASQENRLDLHFTSMPKLGKNDPRLISGFIVKTKAHGLSRDAGNRTKCDLVIAGLTAQEVSGTISYKGMTDMSAANAAPDVTDVTFSGTLGSK
jgi:hypothetical protein